MSHPWILGHAAQSNTDTSILTKMREWNSGRIRQVQPAGDQANDAGDTLMDDEEDDFWVVKFKGRWRKEKGKEGREN